MLVDFAKRSQTPSACGDGGFADSRHARPAVYFVEAREVCRECARSSVRL